jgi:fatty-acyl-CoA synthase
MQPDVHLTRLTPLAFLERSAAAFPERTAVVDWNRRLTWAQLRERVRRLAVALQESGIEKGDRVALLAPNVTELLEAHYGVPASGAVLVAINTRLKGEEVRCILGHSGSRLIVVDPSLAHLVESAPVERVLVTGAGGDYEAFLERAREGEPEDRLESEDDTISINYTSGTTGRPKGMPSVAAGRSGTARVVWVTGGGRREQLFAVRVRIAYFYGGSRVETSPEAA